MALSILLCTILITIILSTKGKVDPDPPRVGGKSKLIYTDSGGKLQEYSLEKGDKIAVTIKGTQKKKRGTFTRTYTCGVLTQDFLKVWFLAFDEVDSTNPTKHEDKSHKDL
eukprot:220588_1